ncbi:hypothetical protein [Lachnobacterium bovis]|uniref:Uncharacterized protein n=1 Tax=Lachnobacterium bovis TaxID=140626 RepID=A0A1H9TSI9_9FIRM|nr:hypothetical protein [Lachnobacterium bovis]SES00049.1 hypothetical protein SAMN02910429_01752 [Lachnobacterium bovis]
MKRIKQILAILGIIVLTALYLSTIFCAIFDTSNTQNLFAASIVATFIIPVLIWTYTFVYKIVTKKDNDLDELREQIEEMKKNDSSKK